MFVFAHAGHWLIDLLIYGSPVVLGLLALKYVDKKAKQEDEEEQSADETAATAPADPAPEPPAVD